MWEDEVRSLLAAKGPGWSERVTQEGTQFQGTDGEVILLHPTGEYEIRGTKTEFARTIESALSKAGARSLGSSSSEPRQELSAESVPHSRVQEAFARVEEAPRTEDAPAFLVPDARSSRDEPIAERGHHSVSIEHVKVSVQVPLAEHLSQAAQDTFQVCLQRFADDLASESERLEQGARVDGVTQAEFTSSMVHAAYRVVRTRTPTPKMTKFELGIDVAYAAAGPCFGAMTSYFHSAWQGALFAALFVVWLITLIYKVAHKKGGGL